MIDTVTVARALSRTLGGEWVQTHKCEHYEGGYEEWTVWTNGEREVADPRHSTDVCLEMLHAFMVKSDDMYALEQQGEKWGLLHGPWYEPFTIKELTISGQQLRDDIIRLCAGEE